MDRPSDTDDTVRRLSTTPAVSLRRKLLPATVHYGTPVPATKVVPVLVL